MLEDRFARGPNGEPVLKQTSPVQDVQTGNLTFTDGDPGENAGIDGSGLTRQGATAKLQAPVTLGGNNFGDLKFPLVDNPAYTGRISFKCYKLQPLDLNLDPIFQASVFDNVKGYAKGLIEKLDRSEVDETSDGALADEDEREEIRERAEEEQKQIEENRERTAKELAEGLLSGLGKEPVDAPVVHLFFPLSVQIDDTVDIGTGNLGGLGMGILKGMANEDKITSAVASSVEKGFSNLFRFAMGGLDQDTARYVASKTTKFGPQGLQTAVSVATQTAVNPHTRAVFNQVNLRQFSFTFKFIPASRQEATIVQSIVKHFRTQMYPELLNVGTDGASLPLGYKFPNLFEITFKHRGSEAKIPRLELCYLRGVQSTYNPTGQAFFDDGHPNEIDMTLQFQEFRTLSREDIEKGGY